MRRLLKNEQNKRGCKYCRYVVLVPYGKQHLRYCPAKVCPFHELDKYDAYTDYLKDHGGKESLNSILKTLGMRKM